MSNTQSHLIVKEEGIKIYKDDPASAILCEDQERAKLLIWLEDANGYNSYQYFKPKIGSIYPVPGIEFEPVQIDCKLDDCWFTEKCTHYLNPEKCHSKTVARLIEHTAEKDRETLSAEWRTKHLSGKSESPEIDKEEEDELVTFLKWVDDKTHFFTDKDVTVHQIVDAYRTRKP